MNEVIFVRQIAALVEEVRAKYISFAKMSSKAPLGLIVEDEA